jgi:hypothetical protein
MHVLRSSKLMTTLVLVWFGLFLGSAVASTVINPGSLQMVCAAGGSIKMVTLSGDTGDAGDLKASASMDCPLCASVTAPPPIQKTAYIEYRAPLAHALRPMAEAHIASATAPPLPSRGPPTLPLL